VVRRVVSASVSLCLAVCFTCFSTRTQFYTGLAVGICVPYFHCRLSPPSQSLSARSHLIAQAHVLEFGHSTFALMGLSLYWYSLPLSCCLANKVRPFVRLAVAGGGTVGECGRLSQPWLLGAL